MDLEHDETVVGQSGSWEKVVFIPCDCGWLADVLHVYAWVEDGEQLMSFNQFLRVGPTLLERLKAAWSAFRGDPAPITNECLANRDGVEQLHLLIHEFEGACENG